MAAVSVSNGSMAEQALGQRYAIGNEMLKGEMDINKLIFKGMYGGFGVISIVLACSAIFVGLRTDPPRSKVDGRATAVRTGTVTKSTYNKQTRRNVTTTSIVYYFDATYNINNVDYKALGLQSSLPIGEGDVVQLEYDDSDVTRAWQCCKMSSKGQGGMLFVFSVIFGTVAGVMYSLRNNPFIVNRRKTVTTL